MQPENDQLNAVEEDGLSRIARLQARRMTEMNHHRMRFEIEYVPSCRFDVLQKFRSFLSKVPDLNRQGRLHMLQVIERLQVQPRDMGVIHAVEHLVASPLGSHQADASQACQMVRNCRGGYPSHLGQGIDAMLA